MKVTHLTLRIGETLLPIVEVYGSAGKLHFVARAPSGQRSTDGGGITLYGGDGSVLLSVPHDVTLEATGSELIVDVPVQFDPTPIVASDRQARW